MADCRSLVLLIILAINLSILFAKPLIIGGAFNYNSTSHTHNRRHRSVENILEDKHKQMENSTRISCRNESHLKQIFQDLNPGLQESPIVNLRQGVRYEISDKIKKTVRTFTSNPGRKCRTIVHDRDLGAEFYPQYIKEITCSSSDLRRCKRKFQNVTLLKVDQCTSGIAGLTLVEKVVSSGCF
ncbi:uncharacterized protein LOC131933405 [Physella acuta]|uniref:uncharacterized protein LOC131933405 n=1 Tax=Physella acuta TaxID=109671 RepID=UPI0027DE934B|nr:uncharacterized protein LOC131933405 [Physella acuta]